MAREVRESKEKEQKKINVKQVVGYLNHAFNAASQKATRVLGSKNSKGTKMYQYQVEFCYLIDNIQRGPIYITPKLITEANELIARLENETAEE